MFRRLGRSTAIIVAVLTIAFATMAIVASAAGITTAKTSTTTVSIGSQATLVTSPSPGVNISVTYSCFPAGYGYYANFGFVRVGDLAGHQGFANWHPTCNNRKQNVVVFVPGNFSAGAGAANAFVCGFDCNGASRQIKIV
jgi:hypothetical protein